MHCCSACSTNSKARHALLWPGGRSHGVAKRDHEAGTGVGTGRAAGRPGPIESRSGTWRPEPELGQATRSHGVAKQPRGGNRSWDKRPARRPVPRGCEAGPVRAEPE